MAESSLALATAAIELIAEKGFERTTAAEIGVRAGYSRNMVRDRYGSKEVLLETLLDREFGRRLLPAFRRERTGTGLDLVLGQVDDLLAAVTDEPEIMKAMIVVSFEGPGPLPSIRTFFADLISGYEAEMVDHLAAGEKDGSVRKGLDKKREAEIFVSYGIGLCFRWVLHSGQFDFPAEIKNWRGRLERQYSAPQ